jgi:hypothetical protein
MNYTLFRVLGFKVLSLICSPLVICNAGIPLGNLVDNNHLGKEKLSKNALKQVTYAF